ncbi:protein phosphatase 2C-like domain-containing protein 1 [Liolophura sinensis]|uniref:protein phosphatase 2C-like domain-containing protein 1 n=1 Tax=Liolophura sinensis TaxID=3198878 RepID=UPI003158A295
MPKIDENWDPELEGPENDGKVNEEWLNNSTMENREEELDRSETPLTLLTDVQLKPDITIFCEKTKSYVDIADLCEHRRRIRALEVMRYKDMNQPDDTAKLFHRRNNLIKQMRAKVSENETVDPKEVQKVNEAYELLKANLEQTFESHRRVRRNVDTKVRGVSLNCSPNCIQAVGICASGNERWKNEMEDTRVYQDCYGGDPHKCFMGLYDGHQGRFAAEIAASELHGLLLHEMSKFDPRTKCTEGDNLTDESAVSRYTFVRPTTKESERVILFEQSIDIVQQIRKLCEEKYESLMHEKMEPCLQKSKQTLKKFESQLSENISSSFKKVHQLLDILLSYGKDECSKVRWSGCSTLNVIIQDFHKKDSSQEEELKKDESTNEADDNQPKSEDTIGVIHLANSGNVRALLIRGNRPYQMSRDHTPYNPKEKGRVLKAGATLSESTKDIRVNGVLATTRGLGNHGDKKLKKCILVEPYTTCVPVDGYAQLLVFASHGVWEVFNNNEVTSLLVQLLPSNRIPPPDRISSSLKLFISTLSEVSRCPSAATTQQKDIIRSRRQHAPSLSSTEAELSPRWEKEHKKVISKPGDGERDDIPEEVESMGDRSRSGQVDNENLPGGHVGYHGDMYTEEGSGMGDNSDNESGHDGDIDTVGDRTSCPALSRLSDNIPTSQEEAQREVAKAMAEYLVQAALLAGAKDNITVFVVLLPGSGL